MNLNLLKQIIKEKGYTYKDCAKVLNISEISFQRKINGQQKVFANDIEDLGDFLCLDGKTKSRIAFYDEEEEGGQVDEIMNTTNQTPIEIALGIDENGMTTARKLYDFLQLNPTHYSRWCKANITDNEFAEENIDFIALAIDGERNYNPNPTIDYKLTSRFAKKLSMKGSGERAEQAREYFTKVEEKTKQAIIDNQQLSPQTQLLVQLAQSIAQKELEDKQRDEKIATLEKTQENIKQAVIPITDNWRYTINTKFNRIQKNAGVSFDALRGEMYRELEQRAGCDLNTRLRNKRARMQNEGCTKTEIRNTNKMDIIEEDKRLREIFSKIVSEYEIRYCA